jgi:hypothetical protein
MTDHAQKVAAILERMEPYQPPAAPKFNAYSWVEAQLNLRSRLTSFDWDAFLKDYAAMCGYDIDSGKDTPS